MSRSPESGDPFARLRRVYPDGDFHDPNAPRKVSAIDGYGRDWQTEARLNDEAARLFSSGGGKEFLDYLKDITIHRVAGFDASDNMLRQLEGARWLVSVIQQRVQAGKKQGGARVNVLPLA